MAMPESFRRIRIVIPAAAILAAVLGSIFQARAADHKDAPASMEGNLDINDLYAFGQGDSITLVMTVHPFLAPGAATQNAYFNPNGLYQFKFDAERDGMEEAVIQVTFSGTGPSQTVSVRGPGTPSARGTALNAILKDLPITGSFNQTFSGGGISAFAGPRDDPFFLHLMGDSSLTSVLNAAYSAALDTLVGETGQQTLAFSGNGVDDFRGTNVLAIVLKMPKSAITEELGLQSGGTFHLWATTSIKD